MFSDLAIGQTQSFSVRGLWTYLTSATLYTASNEIDSRLLWPPGSNERPEAEIAFASDSWESARSVDKQLQDAASTVLHSFLSGSPSWWI